MNREEAITLLKSENNNDRHQASKWFLDNATDADYELLNQSLINETVSWIKYTLQKAISRRKYQEIDEEEDNKIFNANERKLIDEAYSRATQEVVTMLIHEIRPIVGRVEALMTEHETLVNPTLKNEIQYLKSCLTAISSLGSSAASPKLEEFNLGDFIPSMINKETKNIKNIKIVRIGKNPFIIVSDKNLIDFAFSNGLRNAIEASIQNGDNDILVNWGETDKDYWIVILDKGKGIPKGIQNIKKIGYTNKAGHLGMGLAIADRAAKSLEGRIILTPREEGGTSFQIRWKK